jgi:DNA-binding beta-propeller fold protein YncE
MTVDPKGFIHVVNIGNGKVKEYDRDGNLRSTFGKLGDFPGEFTRPRGIAVDEEGQVFVVDAGHQVVQVFNDKHRILGDFGAPGLEAGSTNLPAGVAVSRDKDIVAFFQKYAAPKFKLFEVVFVTNQYSNAFNHALSVYGMGALPGAKEREAEDDRIRELNEAKKKANKPNTQQNQQQQK